MGRIIESEMRWGTASPGSALVSDMLWRVPWKKKHSYLVKILQIIDRMFIPQMKIVFKQDEISVSFTSSIRRDK